MDLLATQPHIHRSDPLVDAAVVMAYCDALGKDVCASMLRAIHKDTKQSKIGQHLDFVYFPGPWKRYRK